MSESTEPLDGHHTAWHDLHLPDTVEDCYAGAEDGGVGGGVDVLGDADYGFRAEGGVFAV